MTLRIACLPAMLGLLLGACGGDDAPASPTGPDANPACTEPTSVLPAGWSPIDTVSAGEVGIEGELAAIDGTAGGAENSADSPYIYLSFSADSVTKVSVTDVESYGDTSWDLAIKRAVLRVNGGDSGPGGVAVAAVEAGDLADVTEAPADSEFATDDWVSDDCQYNEGQVSEPLTAIGTWYDYDIETNQLAPMDVVYVLRRPDGAMFKFAIASFYHDDISGYYEIEWAAL